MNTLRIVVALYTALFSFAECDEDRILEFGPEYLY